MSVPNRLTIVETLSFNPMDREPKAVTGAYSRKLSTNEEPYSRATTVGQEWAELSLGWVEECGMLYLSNEEGKTPHATIPTEAEVAEVQSRILEVSLDGANRFALVLAGESQRFQPAPGIRLWVRSQSGPCRYRLFALPR